MMTAALWRAGGVGYHAARTTCAPAARSHASHRSAAPANPRQGAAWAPAAGTAWRPPPAPPALRGRMATRRTACLGLTTSVAAAPTAAPRHRRPRSRLRWRPSCLSMQSQQTAKGLQAKAAQTAGTTTPRERTTARMLDGSTTGRTPCRRGCCLVAQTLSAGSPTRAACATTQVRWWLLRCRLSQSMCSEAQESGSPQAVHTLNLFSVRCQMHRWCSQLCW